MIPHYLQPLLAPRSVALLGATERAGALGSIVYRNLAAGALHGELFAVHTKHPRVLDRRAYARLADLPFPPDLAVIATPARTVPGIIEEAGAAGVKAAVVLSSGFGEAGAEGRRLQEEMRQAARRGGGRILRPKLPGAARNPG